MIDIRRQIFFDLFDSHHMLVSYLCDAFLWTLLLDCPLARWSMPILPQH